MPHNSHNAHSAHTGSSGDDLGSTDEVKIFKDEGDREDEKISSENLLEEKSSLIDLTESEEKSGKSASKPDHSPVFGKIDPHTSSFNMGYLVSPYSYTNGAAAGLPVSMANKMGLPPFFCHNGDPLTTPPPAHCGIPPYQLDPKAMGLTRPAIYPFPTSQYAYPMLSPDMSQVAASWHTPSVYSAASSFRSPYPSSLPINTTLPSDFSFRFSPSLLPSVHASPHHVLNSHPAIVTPGPKQEVGQESNHRYSRNVDQKNSPNVQSDSKDNSNEKKKPHIKKPLNAFMLYMKEMRAKVVAECTLKESAAINQILGRRWHALGREEQAKYYELARRERQLHMQMYPDWSSRTNATRGKKRKRKQDTTDGGNNMKKCRARFGLDQQNQWCKPCRRKKKCIRYMEIEGEENGGDTDNHVSDDNLGSCGSVDGAKTPDDDTESLNQSLSSPGCLSALSSLQSPSTSLTSPLNLLTSPSTPSAIHSNHEQIIATTTSATTTQQLHHQNQHQTIYSTDNLSSHHHQQHHQHHHHQQHQQINNNSQLLNNLDKQKKCTGNDATNDVINDVIISNNSTINKHSIISSQSNAAAVSSILTSMSSETQHHQQQHHQQQQQQHHHQHHLNLKSEKHISNISSMLGINLAGVGFDSNEQHHLSITSPSPSLTTALSLPPSSSTSSTSSLSSASSSSSSLLSSSIPNHLFLDSMNKIPLINIKSEPSSSIIGEMSSIGIQSTNIDDRISLPAKLLSLRHQHHNQQHYHQQIHQQQNSNASQSSSNIRNDKSDNNISNSHNIHNSNNNNNNNSNNNNSNSNSNNNSNSVSNNNNNSSSSHCNSDHKNKNSNNCSNSVQSTTTTTSSTTISLASTSSFAAVTTSDMFTSEKVSSNRNPIGANPRDINNPLSVNQLTKRDYNISMPNSPSSTSQLLSSNFTTNPHLASPLHVLSTPSPSPTLSSLSSTLSLMNNNNSDNSLSNSKITIPSSPSSPSSSHHKLLGNEINSNSLTTSTSGSNMAKLTRHQPQLLNVLTPQTSQPSSPLHHPHHHPHHHHHHHHPFHHHEQHIPFVAFSQNLQQISAHHFPTMIDNLNRHNALVGNNLTASAINATNNTKLQPPPPSSSSASSTSSSPSSAISIDRQSNSKNHRNNDGESGAISVT